MSNNTDSLELNSWQCPIAKKIISADICYEVIMCLTAGLDPSSVPEVDFRRDSNTIAICNSCPHCNLE